MYYGHTGKILWVNLSNGKIIARDLDREQGRKYIGGAGLAAKIIWDETTADTAPFSADNPLIFVTGPVTGTRVPTSGRYIVASLSPLTNIWGQAHSGGTWGYALKLAGWDAVVVKGISRKPVYLWIDGDNVELRDASHVWGKDNWAADELLKAELGKGVGVASIGRAGERLVRFAMVVNDGKMTRAAARCGLGAVMGSKKLKAIAVRGNKRPSIYDDESLKSSIAANYERKHLDWETELVPRWSAALKKMWEEGKHGIKNYQIGDFEGFEEKYKEDMLSGEKLYCTGCSVSCIESKSLGDKRRMTGECASCMGARCLIDDYEGLAEAYDLCNQYGMDAMSVGGVVGFAMECYEKGLITTEDTGGIDLTWGNCQALITMVRQIGEREGFGNLLGEGIKRAAEQIGGLAPEYAIHVKGHELPLYDLRAWNAGALEWATASSGAHHFEGLTLSLSLTGDFLGGTEIKELASNRFAVEGVGKLTAMAQDYGNVQDSLITCKMLVGWTHTGQVTQPAQLLDWLNCVTGWQMNKDEFLKAGERIFNLKRMISVRRGISRKDDTIPARFLTSKRGVGVGGTADNLPPLGTMLNEYYAYRGWSEEGVPTRDKLKELGLEELVECGW